MRSTWLPLGLALIVPATGLLACGPGDNSTSTSGGGATGGSTTSTSSSGGSTSSTTSTGGSTGGTGGSTTSTGGTGGSMPPDNDACPGQKVVVAVGASQTVPGSIKAAADDYTTFCADKDPGPGAPDVVYQLDVPDTVSAQIEVNATGFVPAISIRKQMCNAREASDVCLDLGKNDLVTKLQLDKGTYWVVVDSADKNVGDFDLTVKYDAPVCGDGVLNTGEECDPAAPSKDDGCINPKEVGECKFGEKPQDTAIIECPGGVITIAKNDSFQLGPYNNGAGKSVLKNNSVANDCSPEATGPENVFHITPTGDGMLKAQIGHTEDGTTLYCDKFPNDCGDFIMYMRKNMCASMAAGDQLSCADNTINPNSPFGFDELLTISVPVTKGQDYWLVVDGLDPMYGIGTYYLELSLQ